MRLRSILFAAFVVASAMAPAQDLRRVVYPEAGHAFNLRMPQFVHREADAADGWTRMLAFLNRLHPARAE